MLAGSDPVDAVRVGRRAAADRLRQQARRRVRGPAVTPLVLAAVADATEGRSVPADLALVDDDAAVATSLAAASAAHGA